MLQSAADKFSFLNHKLALTPANILLPGTELVDAINILISQEPGLSAISCSARQRKCDAGGVFRYLLTLTPRKANAQESRTKHPKSPARLPRVLCVHAPISLAIANVRLYLAGSVSKTIVCTRFD